MIKLILATLVPFVVCTTYTLGATDGKFFYAGFAEETTTYRLAYYTNMNIGTRVDTKNIYIGQNEPLQNATYLDGGVNTTYEASANLLMAFSTQEYAFSFITGACTRDSTCNIDEPNLQSFHRDSTNTPSANDDSKKTAVSYPLIEYKPQVTITGEEFVDNVGFLFEAYNRITMVDGFTMVGVKKADPTGYHQLFNGIIGIQPAATANAQYDFLDQLKLQGKIENKIISFYMNTNNVYEGVVQIGTWDRNGIAGNRDCATAPSTCVDPSVMKTQSATDWTLTVGSITQGGDFITSDSSFLIDPSERLIKMTENDFNAFNTQMLKAYPDLDCTSSTTCLFKSVCAQTDFAGKSFEINIDNGDADAEGVVYNFALKFQDIFFDSYIFEDNPEPEHQWCHSVVSKNLRDPTTATIILGSPFLRQYYVVFDQTPTSESKTYLQVGIGPKNYENSLGTFQYDSKSSVYSKQPDDQSLEYTVPAVASDGNVDPTDQTSHQRVMIIVIFGVTFSLVILVFVYYQRQTKRERSSQLKYTQQLQDQQQKLQDKVKDKIKIEGSNADISTEAFVGYEQVTMVQSQSLANIEASQDRPVDIGYSQNLAMSEIKEEYGN